MSKLNYKKVGEGKPLIILHGLFGSLDNWLGISKQIADEGYAVYMIDQRNHGKSPHFPEHNYTLMAQDLKEFISYHNLQSPIILGHSMGGKTVMKYAVEYPESIEKLIVADIAPRYYKPHHSAIIEGLNAVNPKEVKSRNEADEAMAAYIPEPGIRQFLLKNLDRTSDGGFEWKMNLPVIAEQINNIGEQLTFDQPFEKPTLFMAGALSNYISEKDHEEIKTAFPKAKIVSIKKAGHWLHAENPNDFLAELKQFLNE